MRRISGLLVFFLLSCGSAAYGDTSPLSHNCTRPLKQSNFATQFELDRYRSVVDLYRSYLEAFVKEQEKAYEAHQRAAQSAIDDWNKFVGQEAKDPPRAPEDRGGGQEFKGNP